MDEFSVLAYNGLFTEVFVDVAGDSFLFDVVVIGINVFQSHVNRRHALPSRQEPGELERGRYGGCMALGGWI